MQRCDSIVTSPTWGGVAMLSLFAQRFSKLKVCKSHTHRCKCLGDDEYEDDDDTINYHTSFVCPNEMRVLISFLCGSKMLVSSSAA